MDGEAGLNHSGGVGKGSRTGCYQVWSKLCLQEDDGRSRGFVVGARPPSVPSKHLPRPPNGLTNATTSLSLVNEQPAHPAELAGKPPPEGTKVFVMELLEFGGLADVT